MTYSASPMTPKSATSKISAARSGLTAMTIFASFISSKCWIAPLIPTAMYTSGLTRSPRAALAAVTGAWQSNFSREGYIAAVERVVELILAGDLFQANIAQRFTARVSTLFDPLAFYCRLRALNPAPFAALLRYGKSPLHRARRNDF